MAVAAPDTGANPLTPPTVAPTPKPAAAPTPSLAGEPATTSAGAVSLTLRCPATSRCSGTVKIYATVRATAAKAKTKRVAIGSINYAIPAGDTAKVKLTLNRTGKKLLRRGKGRLPVSLEIKPSGQNARASMRRLTLKAKRR